MADQSLFNAENKPATQPTEEPTEGQQTPPVEETPPSSLADDSLETMLASIKSEDGRPKYKDVPTALEALRHSQEFIPGLKQQLSERDRELEQLRSQLQERESVDDLVNRLASQEQPTPETPPAGEPKGQGSYSEEELQSLVDRHISQREAQQRESANLKSVEDTLRERYGDKASEALQSKSEELGLSPNEIGDWAKRSPKAVLSWFSEPAPQESQGSTPNRSSVNIPPSNPNETIEPQAVKRFASSKEKAASMAEHRRAVYQKLGIQE